MERIDILRKMVVTGMFAAIAVILSGISFPVGPTKVFPFQHTVNAIAGVLIGPWYGAVASLIAAILRNALGTGTIFAFPGGIPGVLVVGLFYQILKKDWCALAEPVGTGPIGATISALIVAPFIGKSLTVIWFQSAFLASSIPGTILGYLILKALRKVNVKNI